MNNWKKQHGKETGTFYFKRFKVADGRSTMKVGTDAVLLGAIAEVGNASNILEIGTGCGVIAIMLAQQSQAIIDAIEIDEESAKQAKENVRLSQWKDHIVVIHTSLQDFIHQTEKRYDLIVSNPPFFSRSLKSLDKKRNLSRHNDSLGFEELAGGSAQLMLPGACFWVILPVKESGKFIETAVKSGFFVHYKLKIFPKTGKECHRVILQLKKTLTERIVEKTLAIRNQDHSYSKEYMEATKEFYIDF